MTGQLGTALSVSPDASSRFQLRYRLSSDFLPTVVANWQKIPQIPHRPEGCPRPPRWIEGSRIPADPSEAT